MVNFRDYTSPSSKLKYLIIESTESPVQIKLLVHTPLTGWYAGPWPPLRNTLHVTNWTSECKLTTTQSSQTWSLQERKTDSSKVSLSRWIGFWYKKALRYEPAPPRREKKNVRLKFTHNPTGAIPETSQWSRDEERVFSKFGVRPAKKEETYLASFLSCWLCAFVLPSEESDFIQAETFKMETMMATKRKISLAVPILASIYSDLSQISQSSQLDLVRIRFLIHYVYGCLAHYFKTHYAFVNGSSNPLMVAFLGEGAARYYDKKEARKRIHQGDNIAWASTMLNNSYSYDYIDDNDAPELELNYFSSILFGYLPLRNGNSVIIEPYSPHRFSRQSGFYQRIPGVSAYDNRSASLDEGLRYWQICVLHQSMSHATFPPVILNVKKLFADDYKTWWSKTHGNFLDSYFQILVDADGPISTKISEVAPQRCSNATPKTSNSSASMIMLSEQCKFAHDFKKQSFRGESTSSYKDCCWKKVRSSNKSGDANLVVLEIPDNVDSPSRTLTVPFKELNCVGALPRGGSQESGESVFGPNPIKLSSAGKTEKEATSIHHDGVRARLSFDLQKHPTAVVYVFDGKKDMEAARKELSITTGERLSNAMFEEHEKIEKASSTR
ncbi:hypothetical protein HAX54_007998 [Datura stramonium]|uniref:Aminotransferase-like plant mobile domain-containing protein n=1 Tax=Datura stramonium TaxID=4076 RepID=A0ABS8WV06_DATST|nr:hypothetical protein [Datura stramonium]